MQPHQQRVVEEKRELDEKVSKLAPFIGTQTFAGFPAEERERMVRQLNLMIRYSQVLGERVAEFKETV